MTVTRQEHCRRAAAPDGCRRRSGAVVTARSGHDEVGARAHGVFETVPQCRGTDAGRDALSVVRRPADRRCAPKRSSINIPAGLARRRAHPGAGQGTCGTATAARQAICYITVSVRAASDLPPRRRRSARRRADRRSRSGARRQGRSPVARRRRARCGFRRARSRVSVSGCASAACRRRATAARGDLVVEVRLVLPRVLDERSKELLREFGRINRSTMCGSELG